MCRIKDRSSKVGRCCKGRIWYVKEEACWNSALNISASWGEVLAGKKAWLTWQHEWTESEQPCSRYKSAESACGLLWKDNSTGCTKKPLRPDQAATGGSLWIVLDRAVNIVDPVMLHWATQTFASRRIRGAPTVHWSIWGLSVNLLWSTCNNVWSNFRLSTIRTVCLLPKHSWMHLVERMIFLSKSKATWAQRHA